MAPRKNDENTAKKICTRKRVLKVNGAEQKKAPTVMTIKIPTKTYGSNGMMTKFNKKQVSEDKKLDLANEVALAQFIQPDLIKDPLQLSLLALESEPVPTAAVKGKSKLSVLTKDSEKNLKTTVKNKRMKKEVANVIKPDCVPEEEKKEVEVKIQKKSVTRKPTVKKITAPKISQIECEKVLINGQEIIETPPKRKRGRKKLIRSDTSDVPVTKVDTPKIPEEIKEKIIKNLTKTTNNPTVITKRNLRKKMVPKRYLAQDVITASTLEPIPPDQNKPGTISRKTSCNSIASCPSWTQDISLSSTTTCVTVTSNDIVRIDKKMPMVSLVPVQKPVPERSSSSSSSSSSSDSEDSRELNLSVSTSVMPENQLNGGNRNDTVDVDAMFAMIEDLTTSFREFESVLDARLGTIRPKHPTSVFDALKRESGILMICRSTCRNLGVEDDLFARPAPPKLREKLVQKRPAIERPLPTLERPLLAAEKSPALQRPSPALEKSSIVPVKPPNSVNPGQDEFTSDLVRFVPLDHEDDDALSLFAESLTGIESSRISNPVLEEYIPTPMVPLASQRHYRPTRIENQRLTICEKQSADSTSVKDVQVQNSQAQYQGIVSQGHPQQKTRNAEIMHSQQHSNMQNNMEVVQENRVKLGGNVVPLELPKLASQSMNDIASTLPARSLFFRGICYFFLALGRCRYAPCLFSHDEPNIGELRQRLRTLHDFLVLRECKLIQPYPRLRQRFAALFTLELARRGLTRPMLETLELAIKSSSPGCNAVLEAALMHLNTVDLNEVQDTLRQPVCDEMLVTLANTQNFSRFRNVFSKLAQFLAENKRRVQLDVVSKILERVCILPCEEKLARAMLTLIKQTDPNIYNSEMMASFEAQLDVLDGRLLEELLVEKRQKRTLGAESATRAEPELQERYTSPDTTHYDNTNHTPTSPLINRKVDLNQAQHSTTVVSCNPLPPLKKFNYNEWRRNFTHTQKINGIRLPLRPGGLGPHMRPNGMRHIRPLMRPNMPKSNMPVRPNMSVRPNMPVIRGRTITKRHVTIPGYGSNNIYQRESDDFYD